MARPAKIGLDYYPMDVGFLRDKKVRLLRTEFGASSVLFVLYVLGKVYEGDGYFLKWDKDEALIAADELHESLTYISEVLQGCLSRSLFDERVFQVFGVLTSAGIQRRYLRSCEKRGDISIISEYWLLNVEDKKDVPDSIQAKLTFFDISGGNNSINSPGNQVNYHDNPESKVKESKVNTPKPPKGGGAKTVPEYQPEWFERFWALYPRHANKAQAVKAWDKLKPDRALCDVMATAIRAQMKTAQWQETQHIPHPSTWLNGSRWLDEVDTGGTSPEPPRPKITYHREIINGEEVDVADA